MCVLSWMRAAFFVLPNMSRPSFSVIVTFVCWVYEVVLISCFSTLVSLIPSSTKQSKAIATSPLFFTKLDSFSQCP